MSRNFRPVTLALLAALALPSCAKKADSERSLAPGEAGGATAGDDLDALEAMLSEREDQLRALGTTPPGSPALGAVTEKRDVTADEVRNADAAGEAAGPDVAPTSAPAAGAERAERPRAKQAGASDRCVNICELQSSICQLQDQICGLVPRHEGEPRYTRACERATADCSVATEACHACS